jgi:transposase InsO family protein
MTSGCADITYVRLRTEFIYPATIIDVFTGAMCGWQLGRTLHIGLWAQVAASWGHEMVVDGIIRDAQRAAAEADYRLWIKDSAESQVLYLMSVEGGRP